MYQRFYGLKNEPFGLSPDPRYLCLTPSVEEAYAALHHCVVRRKGFAVLTGQVGTGKTTLVRALLNELERRKLPFCYVFNPRLDPNDFLDYLLADLGIEHKGASKSQMLFTLNEFLLQRYAAGQTTVLIVDEAQQLSDSMMEEIRLLTNLETDREKLLQVILVGQPELRERLDQHGLRQVRQRVFSWTTLDPLSREETLAYIEQRLRRSGSNGRPIFSVEAGELIYVHSRGIPRVINLLCEHALLQGYIEEARPIGSAIVQQIVSEFKLETAADAVLLAVTTSGRVKDGTHP